MNCRLCLLLLVIGFADSLVTPEEWRDFKLKYEKSYATKELDDLHLSIYARSREECKRNIELFERGEVNFRMAINEYSDQQQDMKTFKNLVALNPDMYKEEMPHFRSINLNSILPPARPAGYKTYDELVSERIGRDWRQLGAVSPVGNQKACKSCWAFSSTGALEAQMRLKQRRMINLSPKYLLDCSKRNFGCAGGWVSRAFEDVIETGGIATKESYSPYKPQQEICHNKSEEHNDSGAGIMRHFITLPMGDEKLMAETVYNIGPVTVSIDGTHPSFDNYGSGIYVEPACKNSKIHLTHSVLVVGFGSDWIDGDYWIIKNSYGLTWGDQGYMLMARNRNNMCGIATMPQYPVL